MDPSLPSTLVREGLQLMLVVGGPVLGALLVAGLVIGVLQAATQINDSAVGFLPKLAVGGLVLAVLGSWMMQRLAGFLAHAMQRMAAPPF